MNIFYLRRGNWEKRETTQEQLARVCNTIQLDMSKKNQKNKGVCNSIQPTMMEMNQKNTGPSEEDEHIRDVTDPYPGVPRDYVYPQKDYTEEVREQELRCSKIALEYYNKRNGTKYELVEPMSFSIFGCGPICMHLNFMAKPKSAPDGDAKLFFVEFFAEPSGWVVNTCRIIKGKSSHCDFCDDTVKHPTHGFRMKQRSEPYALRSQARGCTVG